MRRIKKSIFLATSAIVFAGLWIAKPVAQAVSPSLFEETTAGPRAKSKIRGVGNYGAAFPDVQDDHMRAARRHGVRPVEDRAEAERRKSDLVCVEHSPWVGIDATMSASIPYLVPRAAELLDDIGRAFADSLLAKGVPLARPIMTSGLRTEADVRRLLRRNPNASPQSCHRMGTTFDLAQNRYETVGREVRNDTLKYVLSEVLRDLRAERRCLVKYEVKQACFHITVR